MSNEEATRTVVDVLEDLGISYMLVGSFSSNYHGVSRMTKDADFVFELGTFQVEEIAKRLGASFRLDPQMSFETATFSYRHIIEILGSPFTIELFHVGDDEYDVERFRRRIQVSFLGRKAWMASKEDVIVTKLLWLLRANRDKDRNDVRDVISVQRDNIDWPYIEKWCERHGTRALLDDIRQSLVGII